MAQGKTVAPKPSPWPIRVAAIGFFLAEIAVVRGAASPFRLPKDAIVLATGTGIFKPGIQGTLVKATNRQNSSMAWGIFYQTVNIGGWMGPLLAAQMRQLAWSNVFYACAAIISINFLFLLMYREPDMDERIERRRQIQSGELKVGLSGDQPPFNAKGRDGQLMGLEVDLALEIAPDRFTPHAQVGEASGHVGIQVGEARVATAGAHPCRGRSDLQAVDLDHLASRARGDGGRRGGRRCLR